MFIIIQKSLPKKVLFGNIANFFGKLIYTELGYSPKKKNCLVIRKSFVLVFTFPSYRTVLRLGILSFLPRSRLYCSTSKDVYSSTAVLIRLFLFKDFLTMPTNLLTFLFRREDGSS